MTKRCEFHKGEEEEGEETWAKQRGAKTQNVNFGGY